MRTALKTLYDQIDVLNAHAREMKRYEATFASVHKSDQHAIVVQSLALKTCSALINVNRSIAKLENIMEVEIDETINAVPEA